MGRFKGRFLFWANTYEDCGGIQFYANVVDRGPNPITPTRTPTPTNTNPSRSRCRSPNRSRSPTPNQVFDGVVARHRFVRAEALLSWGRATSSAGHVYAPNLRIQFTENTVVEGNHLWNWNGSCPVTAASNRARVL